MTTAAELLKAWGVRSGKRGRPKQSGAQMYERHKEVYAAIYKLLDSKRRWGDLSQLQRKTKKKHGIASSEFYRIAQRAKLRYQFDKENEEFMRLVERYITPEEWEQLKECDGRAIYQLCLSRQRGE